MRGAENDRREKPDAISCNVHHQPRQRDEQRAGPKARREELSVGARAAARGNFRRGAGLNPPDRATFYGGGAKGYTDYPALAAPISAAI